MEYRDLQPGMLQLCTLEALQETVLGNVLIDSKPHIGRARLQLQYLWTDIAGRCSTVQVDYMPCVAPRSPTSRLLHMTLVVYVLQRILSC